MLYHVLIFPLLVENEVPFVGPGKRLPVGSSTSGKVFSCIQPGLAWRRHGFWHCNQAQVLVLLFRKALLLLILCSFVQSLLLIVGFFVNSVSVGLLLRPTIVGAAFLFFLLYLRFRGRSRHRGFGRWGPSLRRWVSTLGTARASRRRGRADTPGASNTQPPQSAHLTQSAHDGLVS